MAQQPTTDSDSMLKEKEFKEGDDQDQCPVCLDKFNPKETICELPCQHSYHRTCVEHWLKEYAPTCPVCRHKVLLEGAHAATIMILLDDSWTEIQEMYETWGLDPPSLQ